MLGRVIPHREWRIVLAILSGMKVKEKKRMAFGDLILAAYQVWGAGLAEKMVQLAFSKRLVAFRQPPRFSISAANGRFV